MDSLADLDHVLGQTLQGSVDAQADFDLATPGGRARLRVDGKNVGVPAQQLQTLQISGEIDALSTQPTLALQLATQGLIQGVPAHAQAQLSGPLNAVVLHVNAGSEGDITTQTQLDTTASLDVERRELRVISSKKRPRPNCCRILSSCAAPSMRNKGTGFSELGPGSGIAPRGGRRKPAWHLTTLLRTSLRPHFLSAGDVVVVSNIALT